MHEKPPKRARGKIDVVCETDVSETVVCEPVICEPVEVVCEPVAAYGPERAQAEAQAAIVRETRSAMHSVDHAMKAANEAMAYAEAAQRREEREEGGGYEPVICETAETEVIEEDSPKRE